jgi:hypothetical protein
MLPTITPRPSSRARLRHRQALGQPAALVELDVHDVEAADQPLDIAERQRALVRRKRDRAVVAVEVGFAPPRQRLFEQLHVGRDQRRDQPRRARRSRKP